MATLDELKYILGLDVSQFLSGFKKANEQITINEDLLKDNVKGSKKEIDDLRAFQFKNNQINSSQYLGYLQNRLSGLKNETAKEKIEYNKLQKKIAEVRQQAEKPVEFSSNGLDNILSKVALLGGAYLGLSDAVTKFRELQSGLANVASLGVNNLDELKAAVLEIGEETPVPINDLVNGLYEVVSAGVDSANQITVLESSAKAAKAGLAETTDALRLGSSVIKGYGKDWADFESIMDLAFNTVKLGQTNFKDLANNAGQVIPSFAALKINTTELFGAFATLTGVTGNTSEVATQLKSVAEGLARPTTNLTALIKQQGFASVEQAVANKGLAGVLKILQDATQGSATKMAALFSSSEAMTALLSLTTSQFETFTEKSLQMSNATGAASDAFEVQSQTLDAQLQVLANRFDVVTTSILGEVVPGITVLVNAVADSLKFFTDLDDNTKKLVLGLSALAGAYVALPSIISVVRAAQVALRNSFVATRTAALALQASLGPAGWLALGVTAVATALASYSDASEDAIGNNVLLASSGGDVSQSLNDIEVSALKAAKALTFEQLTEKRKELNDTLDELKAKLESLEKAPVKSFSGAIEIRNIENTKGLIGEVEANIRSVEAALAESKKKQDADDKAIAAKKKKEAAALTAAEQKELDKLREYQFQTNRISLADYVDYLKSRQEAQRLALGEQSTDYLKFLDRIAALEKQRNDGQDGNDAVDANETSSLPAIEVRTQGNETALAEFAALKEQMREVELEFQDLGYQDLLTQFEERQLFAQQNIDLARQQFGAESAEYQQAINLRLALEDRFQASKQSLAKKGARAAIALGTQLMTAFQGQSKTLFNVGKGAAISESTIHAYQAITRAYKDYPYPFNLVVSGIQGALAFAQVAKIASTKFKPAGKALGGNIERQDVVQNFLTPEGEDGIIGVQVDEFIVNRRQAKRFRPFLEAINRGQINPEEIPAFRDGGNIGSRNKDTNFEGNSNSPEQTTGNVLTDDKVDKLIEAVRNVQIVINQETDAISWLRENLPKFDKLQNSRKL